MYSKWVMLIIQSVMRVVKIYNCCKKRKLEAATKSCQNKAAITYLLYMAGN